MAGHTGGYYYVSSTQYDSSSVWIILDVYGDGNEYDASHKSKIHDGFSSYRVYPCKKLKTGKRIKK